MNSEQQALIDALEAMVFRHCLRSDGLLDSGSIAANANALTLLARFGRVEMISCRRRQVVARPLRPASKARLESEDLPCREDALGAARLEIEAILRRLARDHELSDADKFDLLADALARRLGKK